MDFLGFVFTPAGVTDLFLHYITAGAAVGVLLVALSLLYGRVSS